MAVAAGLGLLGWTIWSARRVDPLADAGGAAVASRTVVAGTVAGLTKARTGATVLLRLDFRWTATAGEHAATQTVEVAADDEPDLRAFSPGSAVDVEVVTDDPRRAWVPAFAAPLPAWKRPPFWLGVGLLVVGALWPLTAPRG